jgi:hypothetical protein
MMDCVDEHDAPAVLESAVHLDDLVDNKFVYAYFERDQQTELISTPSGSAVSNAFPVRPRIVSAQRILWKPVLGNDGSGHRFDFVNDEGEHEAHAEVFVSSTAVHRVALVHRLFTPAARASGLVDRNSLLEFNSPFTHYTKLISFLENLPAGQMYLPVNELAVGDHADIPVEIDPRHAQNPAASLAQIVWTQTVAQLRQISDTAMNACRMHNHSEFSRAGLC